MTHADKSNMNSVFRQSMCTVMCGHVETVKCDEECPISRNKLTIENWDKITIGDLLGVETEVEG